MFLIFSNEELAASTPKEVGDRRSAPRSNSKLIGWIKFRKLFPLSARLSFSLHFFLAVTSPSPSIRHAHLDDIAVVMPKNYYGSLRSVDDPLFESSLEGEAARSTPLFHGILQNTT